MTTDPRDPLEANVERLLGAAYRPERPDPAFASRVERAMLAASRRARPRSLTLVPAAAAASILALLVLASWPGPPRPSDRAPARRALDDRAIEGVLAARPRPPAAPLEALEAGATVETDPGERRRVALPDGTTLYLDQETAISVQGERRVRLDRGQLYAEVVPGATPFVVEAGGREVVALGTRFAVEARHGETRVVVTQGSVEVEGHPGALRAGEELTARGVSPAARPSYLLDWTRELMAAAESPLVPASGFSGGALVAIDPYGQEARLVLRRHHVDVHVEDGFARTTIDQTFFNAYAWRMEGTFYFPLPADASLSRLAMYVNGRLMEGGMAERDRARDVYEEIVYKKRDPALLEWVDGTTFKMRVFPLEGRQEKRIVLSYTQKLPFAYGKASYRFPAGTSLDLVRDWSLAVRVVGGASWGWNSPSHELAASREGDDLLLAAEAHGAKPDRDVVLELRPPEPAPVAFASTVHEGFRYLALRFRPDLEGAVRHEKRHWVILFESSGDRDPLLARVQVDLAREVLESAEPGDTFSVLTAGTRVREFAGEPLPCTPENVREAVRYLERAHLVGALDLGAALDAAVRAAGAGENPVLAHLGSGVPILGEGREEALALRVPSSVRYLGIGVGKRFSRGFMREAARATDGFYTQVNPDECVRWRALEILGAFGAPRLAGLSTVDSRFLFDADSVSQGEEVFAVARMPAGEPLPETVTISGTMGGRPWQRELAVELAPPDAGYLPRTWAKLEIDRLVARGAEANREAIVELSKTSYVMSPFTSLLVLESEEMYGEFEIDRGRKDHWALYPCPEEIPVVEGTEPARKPAASQVGSTVVFRPEPRPTPRYLYALGDFEVLMDDLGSFENNGRLLARNRAFTPSAGFFFDQSRDFKVRTESPPRVVGAARVVYPARGFRFPGVSPAFNSSIYSFGTDNTAGFFFDNTAGSLGDLDWESLIYQRPSFALDLDDLVTWCPAMNTSEADLLAVIEAEAEPDPRSLPGEIDPAALALVDAARRAPWRRVEIDGGYDIVFDGTGRHAWVRRLPGGLVEKVYSDGETMLALYPEFGIGARRAGSRFHRAGFAELVPWFVPPVEDLARGAEVRLLDPRVVAVVPRDGTTRLELVFSESGDLAERRTVDIATGKVLERLALDPSRLAAAEAPDLAPDESDLVILPLPYRTGEPNEDPLALLAWAVGRDSSEVRAVIGQRFLARGDRRLGLFTLLSAVPRWWAPPLEYRDPRLDHPGSDLARWIMERARGGRPSVPAGGFLHTLARFENITTRLRQDGPSAARELEDALEFVRGEDHRLFAWAILEQVSAHALPSDYEGFESVPELAYAARYERAGALLAAGHRREARDAFAALHERALAEGELPPIDSTFRGAFDPEDWGDFVRRATSALATRAVPLLAWQLQRLDDPFLAGEAIDLALLGAPEEERRATVLAVVEYLWKAGGTARAEALVEGLLAQERHRDDPQLWRIASQLAFSRGRQARSLAALERALDLEYRTLREVVNLALIRSDYGRLFQRYQVLADAIATLESEVPLDFVARVVRAADRWRELDDDDEAACFTAAGILRALGARELSWEYLTTPLATRPNEAGPLVALAKTLSAQAEFELADWAYERAFEAESTNPQILWDRARNLEQAGRHDDARAFYQEIAEGSWQPRFSSIQARARRHVERR